jgi:hypothetical protein
MLDGEVIADGEAQEILTDGVTLEKASIVPPQIAQIFLDMPELDLPRNIIDVYEAQRILLGLMEKNRR